MQVKLPESKVIPLDEASERLRLSVEFLARRLASPSFFAKSAVVWDGTGNVLGITERGLGRLLESRVEQCYTFEEAAEILRLNVHSLYRAKKAGKLAVSVVLGEFRLTESTLAALQAAPPASFFSRGRKGAAK